MADAMPYLIFLNLFFLVSYLPVECSKYKKNADACTSECLRTVKIASNSISGNSNSCARGCRFYDITQVIKDLDINAKIIGEKLEKIDTCTTMCLEAYGNDGLESESCKTGCKTAALQVLKIPQVVTQFSFMSWFVDDYDSLQILQSDITEPDDVLTDLSLKSQITKETSRIPEIRLRTMPVPEKGNTVCGGGTVKGIPYCLVWSLLLLLTLLALWSCLSLEAAKEQAQKDEEDAPPLPEKHPLV